MADKDESLIICGKVERGKMSWSEKRRDVRKRSNVNEYVHVSLQELDVLDVEKRLAGTAADRSQNVRLSMKVNGLIHILEELTSLDWENGTSN